MAQIAEIFDPRDLDELLALEADDPNLVSDLIADYLVQSAEFISKLKQFDSAGDLRGIEHVAHTLKSSSATLGLRATSKLAGALEEAARNETTAPELLRKIEDAWREGCRALAAFRPVAKS